MPAESVPNLSHRLVLRLKRLDEERLFLRSAAMALFLAASLFVLFRLAGGGNVRPTDYEIELEHIQKNISALKDVAFIAPVEPRKVTRFVHQLYDRVSLTGDTSEFQAVRSAIDRAIALIGPSNELCLLKANLDLKCHRLAEARDDLQMAPEMTGHPQAQALRADFDLQEGKYEDARKGYDSAIRNDRTWDNLARLAYLESKIGDDSSRADELYRQSEDEITAKEMRSYAWVELQRGLLELNQGRTENAQTHYKQASKAYSGYWLVDEHIAELLGAQRKFNEAAALYEKVIGAAPRPELQQALGDLYLFTGKPNLARRWHEKALAAYLESAQRGEVHYFHHLAGFYSDVREDGAEAAKWARKDLERRKNFMTYDALAWAFYRSGRFSEALDPMDQALGSGIQDAHVFFHAAMIYVGAGRTAEGRHFLERTARINPHYDSFHAHR